MAARQDRRGFRIETVYDFLFYGNKTCSNLCARWSLVSLFMSFLVSSHFLCFSLKKFKEQADPEASLASRMNALVGRLFPRVTTKMGLSWSILCTGVSGCQASMRRTVRGPGRFYLCAKKTVYICIYKATSLPQPRFAAKIEAIKEAAKEPSTDLFTAEASFRRAQKEIQKAKKAKDKEDKENTENGEDKDKPAKRRRKQTGGEAEEEQEEEDGEEEAEPTKKRGKNKGAPKSKAASKKRPRKNK